MRLFKTIVLLILLSITLVSILFFTGRYFFYAGLTPSETECKANVPSNEMLKQWLDALAAGDQQTAILIARKLAETMRPTDDGKYSVLFQEAGVSPEFQNAPFNVFDYSLWQRKYFFNGLMKKLWNPEESDSVNIRKVFDFLEYHLKNKDVTHNDKILWPEQIWNDGGGLCDRQAWVASELYRQADCNTMLVMLKDENNISPHTFLEIEKNGVFYLIDTFTGSFLQNVSFHDFRSQPQQAASFWPENPDFKHALKKAALIYPGSAQEYCPRNQWLSLLFKDTIRIADDPESVIISYIKKTGVPPDLCSFWIYPFSLFHKELAQSGGKDKQ